MLIICIIVYTLIVYIVVYFTHIVITSGFTMDENAYTVMLAKIRAFRRTKNVIIDALDDDDITIMQWLYLGVLHRSGDSTAMYIADELDVSRPMSTRLYNQCIEKG